MAEVALHQPHMFSFYGNARSDSSTNFYNEELTTDMDAPQWFTFPTQLPSVANQVIPRNQTSINTGSRSMSHQRANNSLSALPAFSFNPGQTSVTPIRGSDQSSAVAVSAPTTPARAGRHRRAASELIGGTARIGVSANRNGSPVRQELKSTSIPPTMSFGSLPSRLEYRHRRTDTMSQELSRDVCGIEVESDLSLESSMKAVPKPEAVSEVPHDQVNHASPSPPMLTAKPRNRPNDLRLDASNPPKSPSRHRVGFSDTLEFIPRPLSTISSESGSSMSTVRAHSMSGSISSVMCSGAGSPLSKSVTTPTRRTFAATEILSGARHVGASTQDLFASSPASSDGQDYAIIPSHGNYQNSAEQVQQGNVRIVDPTIVTVTSEASKQRKSGSWNTLLGRKSKPDLPLQSSHVATEAVEITSSPETINPALVELSQDFDTDPTSIIISDPNGHDFTPPITPPVTPNERNKFNEHTNNTANWNVIDLDAALGCDYHHDGRGLKGRSFSEVRRSMHSNAVASGFLSSNIHRRAESAPALTGINFDPAGFRERNSSISSFKRPQMEDVFEEDEDDNLPKRVEVDSTAPNKVCLVVEPPNNMGTNLSDMESLPTTPSDVTGTSSNLDFSSRKLRFDAPWKSNRDGRDDTASYTGSETMDMAQNETLVPDISSTSRNSGSFFRSMGDVYLSKQRRSAGSDTFPLPNRYHSGIVVRTGSPLPSSNCGCGNDCSSAYIRQDTGTTPGNDIRKAHVQSVGERGSDIRYSVDDVPSLISSGSTAISSAHARAPSSSRSFAPRSTSSSLSLSSAVEHHRKRSSIVSFSRFVGGPFSERPRVALEPGKRWQTPLEVEDSKQAKPSRFSRILKFWKPKATHV